MAGFKRVLMVGTGAAVAAASPLASQQSSDAQLEAACRATEVSVPDSCPCTIEKARAVGVSNAQMASLFKDDGHSNPVDQAAYSRFWQVKSQCIMEATMANMGISANNPLPGVPANMRPGAPFPGATVATPLPADGSARTSGRPEPKPLATPVVPGRSAAPNAPRQAAQSAGVTQKIIPGFEGSPDIVEFKRQTPFFDYFFAYSQSFETEPALLAMAETAGRQKFAEVAPNYTSPNRNYREEYHYGWYQTGRLGPLLSIGQSERPGSRGAPGYSGALLWDTERDREIAWTDVFDAGVWNGQVRRDYCAALQAQRRERGNTFNQRCPAFDNLQISLSEGDSGTPELRFVALNGTAGSYAEGPYDVTLPVIGAIREAVKPRYADIIGAGAPSAPEGAAISLVASLGPVEAKSWGDAACSDEVFLLRPDQTMPRTVEALFDFTRSNQATRVATAVDAGNNGVGYLINLGGTQTVLSPIQPDGANQEYSNGSITLFLNRTGNTITDNPAYGFTSLEGEIMAGGDSETFKAIGLFAC